MLIILVNYTVESANKSSSTASKLLGGAQGAFTLGRFGGVVFMHFIRPRLVFVTFLGGAVLFLALAAGVPGTAGIVMLYFVLFFESVCFPTIVALGIRGLGRHYKRGSGFIIAGVIGGAAVPALQGKVADIHNSTHISMVVPMCFMLASFSYAFCVNFVPYYRIPADALGNSDIGIAPTIETGKEGVGATHVDEEAAKVHPAHVAEVKK